MNTKRNALGKGLSALLDNAESALVSRPLSSNAAIAGAIASILIEKIEANPFQPRNNFDEAALKELAESIRQQGIIQPITVRKIDNDRYQIISGERRYRASKLAGLDYIPAYIRIAHDQGMLEMALVENIQRANLNAIEIAISYKRLMDECNVTMDELALKVGKDRTTVTNYLRLLKLPPIIQAAIRDEKISMGHARAIISVNAVDMQLKIFNDIMTNNFSVRTVEKMVRETGKKPGNTPKVKASVPVEYSAIQKRLCDIYETKVEVKNKKNGSGQIILNYFSTDDFNRLFDMLDV